MASSTASVAVSARVSVAPRRRRALDLNARHGRARVVAPAAAAGESEEAGVLDVLAAAAAARRPSERGDPSASSDPSSSASSSSSSSSSSRSSVVDVRGVGVNLGMRCSWRLSFDGGVGFADAVELLDAPPADAPPLVARTGYDPATERAWRVELGGGAALDDAFDGEHRSTLASWFRSGQWLEESARRSLNVKLLRSNVPLNVLVEEHTMVPAREWERAVAKAAEDPAAGGRKGGRRRRGKKNAPPRGPRGGARAEPSSSRRGSSGAPGGGSSAFLGTENAPPRVPPAPPTPRGPGALLAVARRGGRVGARVFLAELPDVGWVPHRVEIALPEGVETWTYGDWRMTEAGLVLPGVSHARYPAGDEASFEMTDATLRGFAGSDGNAGSEGSEGSEAAGDSVFARPGLAEDDSDVRADTDRDAHADAPRGSSGGLCSATRGEGGHFLARPLFDGRASPGWFVLDTASSGHAIDPFAADALDLPGPFGALSVIGVASASLAGRMRRARSVSLGGATARHQPMMEQALAAATRTPPLLPMPGAPPVPTPGSGGDPGGLVGALGTDFMRRCVIDLVAPRRAPGSPDPARFEMFCVARDAFEPSDRVAASWQRVTWIAGAPHVRARVTVAEDSIAPGGLDAPERARDPKSRRSGNEEEEEDEDSPSFDGRLFRLSLGTGGAGAIISAQAAAEWNMVERTVGLQPGGVLSGPGEERSRLARVDPEVISGRLARIEFRGAAFETVRALTHAGGDPPDLALSPHCDGALCADLFRGCRLVLDLGNDRVAVVQE